MARRVIPDPLERRHVLEQSLDPARAARIAEAYEAEGRVAEAVPFWRLADARERLERLREEAVAAGDAFLLKEAARALGERPGPDVWRRLADAAEAAGKDRYAAQARRQAEALADRD